MLRFDMSGLTHFVGHENHTLCGIPFSEKDLFGTYVLKGKPSTKPVTCLACATTFHRVKNTPLNQIDDSLYPESIYRAVDPNPILEQPKEPHAHESTSEHV